MVRVNVGQLRAALGHLTRFPVDGARPVGGDLSLGLVLAAGLVGLVSAVAGTFFWWLAGSVGGGLLGGFLVPPALWWATRGRGLFALLAVARGSREAPERGDEMPLRMAGFQAVLILKLLCTGFLVGAGASLWLFAAWLLAGAALADEWSYHARGARADGGCWLAAAVGCVLVGGVLGQFIEALFLAALVWLGLPSVRRWLPSRVRLTGTAFSWLLVEATEIVVLVLAVLVVFAR